MMALRSSSHRHRHLYSDLRVQGITMLSEGDDGAECGDGGTE